MKILYLKNQKVTKSSLRFSTVILSLICSFLISLSAISQSLGVSATGTPPDASAMLDVNATDKGFLMPRMTTVQRDGIQSPANGLMVYNTDTDCVDVYFGSGGQWESIKCGCIPPTDPTASSGTSIGATSFDANWSASTGVDDYYLDVATNNTFTSLVPGFNNLNVGNVTTYNVTGLTCETVYYYRVRAKNTCRYSGYSGTIAVTAGSCPFVCGSSLLTDTRDNETYQTVQIGTQCWMKENLNYNPGSGNTWCNNCSTYGRLYDWDAAMANSSGSSSNPSGVQGACPTGWHLPSDAEWCQMENTAEANTDAGCNTTGYRGTNTGKHLKATSWGNGDNTSGFTALPAGVSLSGSFYYFGSNAYFWTATNDGSNNAWTRILGTGEMRISRVSYPDSYGWSVRCVMD